ncbi:MAG: hypothetical protein VW862_03330, partial [Euryarchaeota archaeon]
MASENVDTNSELVLDETTDAKPVDKVSKELANIRKRRNTDSKRRFPSAIEDWTLLAGFGYGLIYALLIFGMSAGVFGKSTSLDHWASGTFLDSGEQCEELSNTPWIHIYPDNDVESLKIQGKNLEEGLYTVQWLITPHDEDSNQTIEGENLDTRRASVDFEELSTGKYDVYIIVKIYQLDT